MREEVEALRKKVKKELESKRYRHTLAVADTAACLSMNYGIDPERAYIAGILHDCAKNFSEEDVEKKLQKYCVALTEAERMVPALVHAPLGAAVAEREYGITDTEILSAIRFHTTGTVNMSLLEKILYVADFIEPNRMGIPGLLEIRKTAFSDLDEAISMITAASIRYIESNPDNYLDPTTVEVHAYYSKLVAERQSVSERG